MGNGIPYEGNLVVSKGRVLITHWHNIISRMNGILSYTITKTSELPTGYPDLMFVDQGPATRG